MNEFMKFLEESPVCFMAVKNLEAMFDKAGFTRLVSNEPWQIKAGERYYTTVYDSALVAFDVPEDLSKLKAPFFRMINAHTDQPCFRIKPEAQMNTNGYVKFNAEVYGGPIFSTWLDRPLSLAGRVTLRSEDPFTTKTILVDLKKPVLVIPNLAIHMNRNVNTGVELNPQTDMLPVGALISELGNENEKVLIEALCKELSTQPEQILDFDLFTYVTEKPEIVGFHDEFLSAPRLDDLVMVHTAATALIKSKAVSSINMFCGFDHEEIGSRTPQGAGTQTLRLLLEKLSEALGRTRSQFVDDLMGSFMISGDVAHAIHPAHPEKHDPVLKTQLGQGPVIKIAAKQSYMTQSCDYAVYQQICDLAKVPYQKFTNRSDERGGSTLGPVISSSIPCRIMDMGVALLSMHSSRELMAVKDYEYTQQSFITYYNR